MKSFRINKVKLSNNYTGINSEVLGQAAGGLKLSGLKLYLYLCGNKDGFVWELNPVAYANWLGVDYNTKGRGVRKAIDEGIEDLKSNKLLKIIDEKEEKYQFFEEPYEKKEQNVPEKEDIQKNETKTEQIVPEKSEFRF